MFFFDGFDIVERNWWQAGFGFVDTHEIIEIYMWLASMYSLRAPVLSRLVGTGGSIERTDQAAIYLW